MKKSWIYDAFCNDMVNVCLLTGRASGKCIALVSFLSKTLNEKSIENPWIQDSRAKRMILYICESVAMQMNHIISQV